MRHTSRWTYACLYKRVVFSAILCVSLRSLRYERNLTQRAQDTQRAAEKKATSISAMAQAALALTPDRCRSVPASTKERVTLLIPPSASAALGGPSARTSEKHVAQRSNRPVVFHFTHADNNANAPLIVRKSRDKRVNRTSIVQPPSARRRHAHHSSESVSSVMSFEPHRLVRPEACFHSPMAMLRCGAPVGI